MARPRQVLDLARAELLAQEGNTDAEIARQLGVSPKTIQRRKQDSDRFDLALKRGREAAHSVVSNALYRQAKKGNVAAIVWYEKTRRGFTDQSINKLEGEVIIRIEYADAHPHTP
jgi:predicted transcriptional regulator